MAGMRSVNTGGCHDVRVLHHRFNLILLPQDAPEHARTVDPKRLVCAFQRTRRVVVFDADVVRRVVKSQLVGVDAGQEADRPARRLLLHRVRLQRVVHVRDSHSVRRQSQQAGVHPGTRQHHRLRRHAVFLSRLLAHLPQKGLHDRRVFPSYFSIRRFSPVFGKLLLKSNLIASINACLGQ